MVTYENKVFSALQIFNIGDLSIHLKYPNYNLCVKSELWADPWPPTTVLHNSLHLLAQGVGCWVASIAILAEVIKGLEPLCSYAFHLKKQIKNVFKIY